MSGQKFYRFPFAQTGDTTAVPDPAQAGGEISYAEGYGPDYELNPATDPAARRIEREKMNALFNDLTNNIREYQLAGFPEWVTAAQNNAVPLAYPINAYVRHGGAGAWEVYVAIVDGAVLEPGVAVGWATEWASTAPIDPAGLVATQAQVNEGPAVAKFVAPQQLVKAAREGKWSYMGAGVWAGATLNLTVPGGQPFVLGVGTRLAFIVPAGSPAGPITLDNDQTAAALLKTSTGQDLLAGDLATGAMYDATFNGVEWRLDVPVASQLASYGANGDGAIFGYTLSNSPGAPNTHVVTAVGNCRDATNQRSIPRTVPMTKRLDQLWAAGDGNGGRDVGAVAASQTWHVFAILNPTTLATDVLFSQSATAPVTPAGFTLYRRLGAVILDGAGNIRPFVQTGDDFSLVTRGTEWVATANGAGPYYRPIGVPMGIRVKARILYSSQSISGQNPAFSGVYDPALGAPPAFGPGTQWAQFRRSDAGNIGDRYLYGLVECWTDTTAHVYTHSNDAGDTIAGGVLGWEDQRGRIF